VWHNLPAFGLATLSVHHTRAAPLGAWFATAALASASLAAAAPQGCPRNTDVRPVMQRLQEAMAQRRFIAYEPSSLRVVNGVVTPADPAGIHADLSVLRQKFDALITYDAVHGAEQIPAIATALGFRALIIGVWNPAADAELSAAIEAARRFPDLVVGISLGNETLFAHRSDPQALAAQIARVRQRLPTIALTTTEPFHIYSQPGTAALLGQLDFLLVNVHPIFQPWFRDASDRTAAQFVVNVLAELAPLSCGPILVKETGVPSAPATAGFSEQRQASFYLELRRLLRPGAARAFAYFSAFDAPWREFDATPVPGAHPEEAHFGLYDAGRHPKLAARELPPLPAGN
jgi:exo-beta-1,3-glucanase (GH17 family)